MARSIVTAIGVILSAVVGVGTGLYVAGIAPPFPANAWAFNGLLAAGLVLALGFGR